MIGNIREYNDQIAREVRRRLGVRPIPVFVSATAIRAALDGGPLPNLPYVGRLRVKGFRVHGESVFVDISGFGAPGEPAMTLRQTLEHILAVTLEHGTLAWGLTEVGQFQGYLQAWKVTA